VERFPCPQDARATNVRLTPAGWGKVLGAAPGHVANVRQHIIDALTPEQVSQLTAITDAILARLDPDGALARDLPAVRPATAARPVVTCARAGADEFDAGHLILTGINPQPVR
jgi:hypothetical protein